jgi:cellulose biosynthesis protein BcsQ
VADRPHGIITIASGKGGSGKTTSALAIAGALKALGIAPDAVIDLDYGASLTRSYGYEPSEPFSERLLDGMIELEDALHETEEGLSFVPASASLSSVPKERVEAWRDRLKELAKDRILVIDTSDDIISAPVAAAILAADVLAIPIPLSKIDYDRTFPEIGGLLDAAGHTPEIVWFATLVDQRPALFKHMLQTIAEDGVELAAMIPSGVAVREAQFAGKSVVTTAPKSKPAQAYLELGRTIYARLRKLHGAKPGAPKMKPMKRLLTAISGKK